MSFDNLVPLVKKSGSNLSVKEFHHQVNVIFHDIESESYDQIHQDMWESLLEQYKLLTTDFFEMLKFRENIILMDVGCGTGLGSELLLSTSLANQIKKVILVDVSSRMLENAKIRSGNWGIETVSVFGTLDLVQTKADLILTSSVLHHIPDLEGFFAEVNNHLNPGGVFMHIHDPNGDYLDNHNLKSRKKEVAELDKVTNFYQWLNSSPLLKAVFHSLNRLRGRKNHIDRVNDILLDKGITKRRLSSKEIWSITDIHVEGLPYSTQKGISINEINRFLHGFELVAHRSYGFFSRLGFELTLEYQKKEQLLIQERSKEGRYVAAAWRKNSSHS